MEIKNQNVQNSRVASLISNSQPAGWSCQKCGENNLSSSRYCRKCGSENMQNSAGNITFHSAPSDLPKGKKWKWILIVILVLALAGGVVAGWYFWNQIKQKKEAQNYLINESKAFSSTVVLVNDLSTEEIIPYESGDGRDLYMKKLEEEKDRSDKALQEINISKEKNGKATSNKIIAGTDYLLKQYYQNLNEKVSVYDQYINYRYSVDKRETTALKELDKLQVIFKNPSSVGEVVNSFKSTKQIYEGLISDMQAITPPTGMEDLHRKDIALAEKMVTALNSLIVAFEKNNSGELSKGLNMLDDIMSGKDAEEIAQLKEYQFDEMHKNFSTLRNSADNVKTEMIKSSANLEVEIANVNIEGW